MITINTITTLAEKTKGITKEITTTLAGKILEITTILAEKTTMIGMKIEATTTALIIDSLVTIPTAQDTTLSVEVLITGTTTTTILQPLLEAEITIQVKDHQEFQLNFYPKLKVHSSNKHPSMM